MEEKEIKKRQTAFDPMSENLLIVLLNLYREYLTELPAGKRLKAFLRQDPETFEWNLHRTIGTIFDWTHEEAEFLVKGLDSALREEGYSDLFIVADRSEKQFLEIGFLNRKIWKGTGEFGYKLFVDIKKKK